MLCNGQVLYLSYVSPMGNLFFSFLFYYQPDIILLLITKILFGEEFSRFGCCVHGLLLSKTAQPKQFFLRYPLPPVVLFTRF